MDLIPHGYKRKPAPRPVRLTLAPRVARCPAVTRPDDLVVDTQELGRNFIGCDLKLPENGP